MYRLTIQLNFRLQCTENVFYQHKSFDGVLYTAVPIERTNQLNNVALYG